MSAKLALQKGADVMGTNAARIGWSFPLFLAAVCYLAVGSINDALQLDLASAPVGDALSARLTWAIAALLFIMFFAFAFVACNVIIFRNGKRHHAIISAWTTTLVGLFAVMIWRCSANSYLGPPLLKSYLDATAYCLPGVKALTATFDGLAVWGALLVLTASVVILANDEIEHLPKKHDQLEALSRQLRSSNILMFAAAALLITGVSEVAALHKWPQHETSAIVAKCPTAEWFFANPPDKKVIDTSAVAVSTTVGTIGTLILAAAYLPLAILLRQRAYRVVQPWERTETWLAIHGFALQPMQQLAKILLILSPLLAGGPVNQLISLLSNSR